MRVMIHKRMRLGRDLNLALQQLRPGLNERANLAVYHERNCVTVRAHNDKSFLVHIAVVHLDAQLDDRTWHKLPSRAVFPQPLREC
ncbi:hypothetical protein DES47_105148 [Roseateles toxinivorans]|uniref:Uncharacterized protein n=1 Tax=Roseateles toxinivorans TaxID=270368 RepID=A0A4V3CT48_9BURK|nr:hypothetical protein DES47_105148 [Roseateles toxinivorans]